MDGDEVESQIYIIYGKWKPKVWVTKSMIAQKLTIPKEVTFLTLSVWNFLKAKTPWIGNVAGIPDQCWLLIF